MLVIKLDHLVDGEQLYCNNDMGWVDLSCATRFNPEDAGRIALPTIGTPCTLIEEANE